jgi:hypothetical protein
MELKSDFDFMAKTRIVRIRSRESGPQKVSKIRSGKRQNVWPSFGRPIRVGIKRGTEQGVAEWAGTECSHFRPRSVPIKTKPKPNENKN